MLSPGFPIGSTNADELLRNADTAMYIAKERGGSDFQYFTESMKDAALRKLQLESAQQGQVASRMVKAAISLGSPYAVAFVDMRMPPGWDGIETIEPMWQDDPNLEVVICTAYADYSWEAVFERLGNTDQLLVLKKPFDPIEVKQLAGSLTAKWELARRVDPVAADVSVEPEAPGISEATKLLERYRELVSWLESTVGFGSEREPDGTRDGVVVAVRQYDEMVESLVRGVEAFGDIAKKVVAINEVRLRRW